MYDRGGLSLPLTLGFALLCQHTARNAQPKGRRRRRRRENVIQPLLYTVGRCDKHSRLIFFRIQFRSASFLFPLVLSSSSLVGLHFSALRDDKKRERERAREEATGLETRKESGPRTDQSDDGPSSVSSAFIQLMTCPWKRKKQNSRHQTARRNFLVCIYSFLDVRDDRMACNYTVRELCDDLPPPPCLSLQLIVNQLYNCELLSFSLPSDVSSLFLKGKTAKEEEERLIYKELFFWFRPEKDLKAQADCSKQPAAPVSNATSIENSMKL